MKSRCKHCKTLRQREKGKAINNSFFCDFDCAVKYANTMRLKQTKSKKIIANKGTVKKLTKASVRNNDLSKQHKLTQSSFNKLRVLQELKWFKDNNVEPTCISCGKPKGNDQWCNGHYKTRGAHPELRYDVRNSFLQHNQRCNMRLSGDIAGTKNTHGYLKGLILRFGKKDGQEIIDYCNRNHKFKKLSCDDLIIMRKKFNKEIREAQ